MHFLHSHLSPLLKNLYSSFPATARQISPPQTRNRSKSNVAQEPMTSDFYPALPPRKSSLCSHRQHLVRHIERSIILHDRSALLRSCSLSRKEPTLLDYWHLDLLHDLLICRNLISSEACQTILDQRDNRARTYGVRTYIEMKVAFESHTAVLEHEDSLGSWLPCRAEFVKQTFEDYKALQQECLINLRIEVEKRVRNPAKSTHSAQEREGERD